MATPDKLPEYWLRNQPLPGITPLLQPIAYALLQARDEVAEALANFPAAQLNARPGGCASVAFHLQHLAGVLNRLLTYARHEALTPAQFAAFEAETQPQPATAEALAALHDTFHKEVDAALVQLRTLAPAILTEVRHVGRAQLPTTLMGLLVHAAEHTTRHVGQLLVTARVQ